MSSEPVIPPLAVIGCDFRVAPSMVRARLALSRSDRKRMISELRNLGAADGFLELSTCNRNEWVVAGGNPLWAAELLSAKMCSMAFGSRDEGKLDPYVYLGRGAVEHILYVAVGSKSLVSGERQIAGQLFAAFERSRREETASRDINVLGTAVGRMVRLADESGFRSRTGRGIHSLAIEYLRTMLGPVDRKIRIVVVGLGSIGTRAFNALYADPMFEVTGCNRTFPEQEDTQFKPLSMLDNLLSSADAAIFCTGAPSPIAGAASFLKRSGRREIFVVDIGIPGQVSRDGLPSFVRFAGLDELADYVNHRGGIDICEPGSLDDSVEKAALEMEQFSNLTSYGEILGALQLHGRDLIYERLPRLLESRLTGIPEADRKALEKDLKSMVREYESELLQAVKSTAKGSTNGKNK